MSWICNRCGQENKDSFCINCGASCDEVGTCYLPSQPQKSGKRKGPIIALALIIILLLVVGIVYEEFKNTESEVYTVTFDANGGYNAPELQRVESGEKINEPISTPYKDGYIFSGWTLVKGSAYCIDFMSYTIKEDVTLYAKWVYDSGYSNDYEDEEDTDDTAVVSDNSQMVKVPNVVGKLGKGICYAFDNTGLEYTFIKTKETKGDWFYVTSQKPKAGTMAKKGSTVKLYGYYKNTSDDSSDYDFDDDDNDFNGDRPYNTVPNVIGCYYTTAVTKIKNQEFVVSKVWVYNDSYSKGYVVSQSPSGGTELLESKTVTIYISNGPETSSTFSDLSY